MEPILYICGTSLGNSADIPLRTLEIVRTVDLLVVEEDRPARQVLKAAGIHRDYLKFNEHHQLQTLELISQTLKEGKSVAYFSDQGMPNLSDPGHEVLQRGYAAFANIRIIPGPSSVTAAIAAAPFPCDKFYFAGFPPRVESERTSEYSFWESLNVPIIFMDTPYRFKNLMSSISDFFGLDRKILIAKDISGPSEEFFFSSLAEINKIAWQKTDNFVAILPPKIFESKI